jgi:hypothetical protein
VKLISIFKYKHPLSGKKFPCAFVQDYDIVKHDVDEDDFDKDFGLPKVLLMKRFRILSASSIIRPVRLIPNFRSWKLCDRNEYFVRFDIDYSGLVNRFLENMKTK